MSMNPANYFCSFDELRDYIDASELALHTDDMDVEDIEFTESGLDSRILNLTSTTRAAITAFDGDVDEAAYAASRLVNNFSKPPAWAIELHAAQRNHWEVSA